MPNPSPESYFDWNFPGHQLPGVLKKCLLFAAATDPDVRRIARGVYNTSVLEMQGDIEEVRTAVAARYAMPEALVAQALEDRVRCLRRQDVRHRGFVHDEA